MVKVVYIGIGQLASLLPVERTAHLRLCSGNLVESTEYAALRTDSFASIVDSMIDSNVAFDGGRDRIIVFRTSFTK
jgi:hypothetical protein